MDARDRLAPSLTSLFIRAVALIAAAASLFFSNLGAVADVSEVRVIVHPQNPLSRIDKRALANMFLKKTNTWPDGRHVAPVDLPGSSPTRRMFADQVLKRSVGAVKSYWQQQIFSGRGLPPLEVASEEAVVAFVLSHPGAVGYVSVKTEIDGAKVLDTK